MAFGVGPQRAKERPHADRILRTQDGDEIAMFWTAEDPKRASIPGLATEKQAADFLRATKDPAIAAGTLRRFLRGTWVRTASGAPPEARQRLFALVFGAGLLSSREADEMLGLVAKYVAGGGLRIERLEAPAGGRAAPAKAAPEKAAPTMALTTRTVLSWIGIELVDADGTPVSGEEYEITLPDGSVRKGTTDDSGRAMERGVDPGECQVTFPRLDGGGWRLESSTDG